MEPKITPVKFLKGSPLVGTTRKISTRSIVEERSIDLGVIKKQVIQINSLIKTGTLLKANEEEQKRKRAEQEKFKQREDKLEEQKEKPDRIPKLPSLPRLGFLDRIKKFLFNIFLGYISIRLLPYLPKLAGVVGTISKVQDTIIDISGKILNGLVSFVDKAYEVHDKTKQYVKDIGGSPFLKAFDGLTGAMDKVIEASIIAAIAFSELDGDYSRDPRDRGRTRKPSRVTEGKGGQRQRPRVPGTRPKVTYGRGGMPKLPTRGAVTKGGLLGLVTLIPDILNSWDLWQSQGRGKDALRTFFSAVAGAAAGLGAVALLEAGAAALGVTGVGIPAAIALAVSGFAASSLAGTGAYNLTDALLRKLGLVDNDPRTGKPYAYVGGGSVTRGGRLIGGPSRTVQKPKAKRIVKIEPKEVKPGQSIGGKKNIEKVFPETEQKNKSTTVNPLGYMKKSYKTAASASGLGGIAGLFIKAQLGERPTTADYQNAANSLTPWMQNTIGGGMFGDDNEIRTVVAKAVQDSVAPKVDDIINDLMKQSGLKGVAGAETSSQGPGQTQTDVNIQGGNADFWTLVAIVSREDGDPQGWADVAQSIYNRKGSGAYGNRSIKEIITSDMQYEPTWKYPKPGAMGKANQEWLAIQDLTSASAASGQSEDALKKVAAALLDPSLQKNARDFVQGRIDFRGYGVSGGIQRKAGDNYFGWYNNYKENKIAAVPNFGATVTASDNIALSGPMGTMPGNLSAAQQLASQFGLTMTSFNTGRHAEGSLHYKNRAMDFSNDSVGRGTPQQLAFAQEIIKRYGTSIAQLIYTPLGFSIENGRQVAPMAANDHYDHVHVAFNKGGKVKGKTGIDQVRAMLTHGEFVIDVDSTKALEENYPGFLDALNKADYTSALNVLRNYTSYDRQVATQVIIKEKMIPVPIPSGSSRPPFIAMFGGSVETEDHLASSYAGGLG